MCRVNKTQSIRDLAGFTLLELLVVISIVTLLLGIGVPNYLKARIGGQVTLAHANLKRVETALRIEPGGHEFSLEWFPPSVQARQPRRTRRRRRVDERGGVPRTPNYKDTGRRKGSAR